VRVDGSLFFLLARVAQKGLATPEYRVKKHALGKKTEAAFHSIAHTKNCHDDALTRKV
jgi:hypothetical protein